MGPITKAWFVMMGIFSFVAFLLICALMVDGHMKEAIQMASDAGAAFMTMLFAIGVAHLLKFAAD